MQALRLLAVLAVGVTMAGCKEAAPLTPVQYRTQRAAIVAAYQAGKITTDAAQDRLDVLEAGVGSYCDHHYCAGQ